MKIPTMKFSSQKLYREKIPAQLFSCEFCEILEKTFFMEHLRATVFKNCFFHQIMFVILINVLNKSYLN